MSPLVLQRHAEPVVADGDEAALCEAERAQDQADRTLRQLEWQSRWGQVAQLSADLQEKERGFRQATEELQRARQT